MTSMKKLDVLFKNKVVDYEGRRPMFYFLNVLVSNAWSVFKEMYGVDVGEIIDSTNNLTTFYTLYSDQRMFAEFADRMINDQSTFDKSLNDVIKVKATLIKRLNSSDFSKFSVAELIEFLEEYYSAVQMMYYPAVFLRMLDRGLKIIIDQQFKKPEKHQEIMQILSETDIPSFSMKERFELVELAIKMLVKNLEVDSDLVSDELTRIHNTYCCITLGNYTELPKTIESYTQEVKEILKEGLDKLNAELTDSQPEKKKLPDFLDSYQQKLIILTRSSMSHKDNFKFFLNQVFYLSRSLFSEISKKTRQPVGFLKELSPDEMFSLLRNGKLDKKSFSKKDYVLIGYDNNEIFLEGKDAEIFRKRFLYTTTTNQQEFSGRIACTGYGKGAVKIVHGAKDFHKFKPGDILVTSNTCPNFVPLMKLANAIIAEEGGLTAHVSVVSREFNIPCIVGIQTATKVFKDGDIVEVDAKKGVVRRIE